MVAKMEADVPGTRHGLLRMADNIKELRDQVIELGGQEDRPKPPTSCPECGSMTSNDQCKACEMRSQVKNAKGN